MTLAQPTHHDAIQAIVAALVEAEYLGGNRSHAVTLDTKSAQWKLYFKVNGCNVVVMVDDFDAAPGPHYFVAVSAPNGSFASFSATPSMYGAVLYVGMAAQFAEMYDA